MKCFIILNHTPTEKQLDELKTRFKVKEIVFLSEKVKEKIKAIDPLKWLDEETLNQIEKEILTNLKKGDYLWVQTEYGLTCYLVQLAFKNGFTPIYSTTERKIIEKKLTDEKIKREYIFEHKTFLFFREAK